MLSFVVYPAQQLSPFLCPTNRPSQLPLTQVPLRAAAMLAAHGVPAARSPALDVNTPCGPLVSCLFPFQEEKCGKPDSLVRASVLQPVSQWLWRSPAFLGVNKSLLPLIGLLSINILAERTAPRSSAALHQVHAVSQHRCLPPSYLPAQSASIRPTMIATRRATARHSRLLCRASARLRTFHHRFTPLSERLPEQREALRPPSNQFRYRYRVIIQALGAAR